MSPEQRLTIRQAVDLIAERGPAPITEAALRARIRARRVGVVRVGGRVYTNPLNLVTAGLLPVEALDGVGRVPKAEIDDAELQAWLNPPDEGVVTDTSPPRMPAGDDESEAGPQQVAANRPPDSGAAVERGTSGPLERALTDDAAASSINVERSDEGSSPQTTEVASASGSTARSGDDREWVRRGWRRQAALVVVLAALVAGVVSAAGGGDRTGTVAEVRGASLASVEDVLDRSLAVAGDEAADRGDYDAALELAAAGGDEQAIARWRRAAARIALSRADRAVADGELRRARRHLRHARVRYGDPLPDRRRTVTASVTRAERAARERAAARRARDAKDTVPVVVASPPPASTTGRATGGASSTSGSGSSAGSSGSGGSGGSGGSSTRSTGSGADGPGEFF